MPYYLASNGHRSGKSCNMNSSAPLVSMRRSTSNNLASSTSTAGTAQLGSTKGHSNVLSWAKNLLVLVVLILAGGRISLMVLHYFHPHAHFVLRDLLINQEMLKVPHSATIVASSSTLRVGIERVLASEPLSSTQTVDYVARGRLRASQSSVTFLGVAKDAGYYIPRVLQQIEEMAAYFPKSQAILIEGDSVDNTAQVIEAWRQLSPSNRTVLTYSLIDAMETVPAFNGSIMPREGRLSLARNKALEQLNFHAPTEYIVMVDLDIVGVSMEGFLDTFGRDGWMAMCAHGVILSSFYRDTYAFRMPGLDTNHHKCGSDHLLYGISPEERSQNRKLVEVSLSFLLPFSQYFCN